MKMMNAGRFYGLLLVGKMADQSRWFGHVVTILSAPLCFIYITNTVQRAVLFWSVLHYIHEMLLYSPELCRWGLNYSIHFDRKRSFSSTLQWTPYRTTDCDIYPRYEYYSFYVIIPTDGRMFNIACLVPCVRYLSYIPTCIYKRN
jgi:hypothetical protein